MTFVITLSFIAISVGVLAIYAPKLNTWAQKKLS